MKRFILSLACVLSLGSRVLAGEPGTLEIWRVIDGDTIAAEQLNLPFGVALTNVKLRMADYDAWETSYRRETVSISAKEIELGKRAAKELNDLLSNHPFRVLPGDPQRTHDVYGRLLVKIEVKLPDKGWYSLAEWMTRKGHTRPPLEGN